MKDKSSVIGCIFSSDRKKVLLMQRRDVPVWTLPGGAVEKNETSQKALLREIKEETGYDVSIIRAVGLYTPINRLANTTYLYEAKIVSGDPTLGPETKAIEFFSVNFLPKLLPPPYEEWIKDAYNEEEFVSKKLTSVNYKTLLKNLILHPFLVLRFLLSRLGLPINT